MKVVKTDFKGLKLRKTKWKNAKNVQNPYFWPKKGVEIHTSCIEAILSIPDERASWGASVVEFSWKMLHLHICKNIAKTTIFGSRTPVFASKWGGNRYKWEICNLGHIRRWRMLRSTICIIFAKNASLANFAKNRKFGILSRKTSKKTLGAPESRDSLHVGSCGRFAGSRVIKYQGNLCYNTHLL